MGNGLRHPFRQGADGRCTFQLGDAPCGHRAEDGIHADLQGNDLISSRYPEPARPDLQLLGPGMPRRSMPWKQLPAPSKVAGMFLVVGLGIVFLSACIAASAALLHAGGLP